VNPALNSVIIEPSALLILYPFRFRVDRADRPFDGRMPPSRVGDRCKSTIGVDRPQSSGTNTETLIISRAWHLPVDSPQLSSLIGALRAE